MNELRELLARLQAADPADRPAILAEHLTSSGVNAADLRDSALAHFDELNAADTPASTESLELLADIAEAVTTSLTHAAEEEQRRSSAAGRINAARPAPADNGASGGDGNDTGTAAPDAGGTPAADPAAADPATGQDTQALAAGGQPRVPLGRIPSSAIPARNDHVSYTALAGGDIPGMAVGMELAGINGIADAVARKMQALSRAGRGAKAQANIVTLRRNVPESQLATGDDADSLVARMTAEQNLPGGNLVAAAGWCAPSEVLYDMCPTASTDGLVDLPTITTRRGGIRFAQPPDFSAVYAMAGREFRLTEAQVIAGTPTKAKIRVPCPSWTEVRLGVHGVIIESEFLMERAAPEAVASFVENVLAAHAHSTNATRVAGMWTASTKVTITAPAQPTDPAPYGPGITSAILGVGEIAVTQLRYKYRLTEAATIEAVFPLWLRGAIRSDLAKRNGVDKLQISNAMIDELFTGRGIRPQWVYDWQDSLADAVAGGFGGTPPQVWPATVRALFYPAGTFFVVRQDVITLDGVYDSTNLASNVFTKLFTEEGEALAQRCYTALGVTIPVNVSGGTGAQVVPAAASA
ncbi:major capsid protein [Nonomuraea polychroma]|uniref:major capsid protein n=1 Tax=Nonomuraea polychroma TaxID=46176 RepID=UPI003D93A7F8